MNNHMRASDVLPVTASGEGPSRRRFTLAEVEAMVEAGIVGETERVELIDGVVIAMSPKGRRHEIVRLALSHYFSRHCADELVAGSETPLQLSDTVAPEPDLILYPKAILGPDVRGDTVLLVVEVGASSRSYDLVIKAGIYASFGVREYWVIDAKTLVTTLHSEPSAQGYGRVREADGTEMIAPLAAPELAVRLADLVA
jgi:Uma2 family endonuclease